MGWSSYIHTDCGVKRVGFGTAAGAGTGSRCGFGTGGRTGAGGCTFDATTAAESHDDGATVNGSTSAHLQRRAIWNRGDYGDFERHGLRAKQLDSRRQVNALGS